MNRNIVSVLLGGYGTDSTVKGGTAVALQGEAQFADVPGTVELLTNCKKVRWLLLLSRCPALSWRCMVISHVAFFFCCLVCWFVCVL